MFESNGKQDKAFFTETWWAMFGRHNKRAVLFFLLFLILLLGFVIYMDLTDVIWVPFAMLLAYFLVNMRYVFRQRKLSLERMKEVNGKPETLITTRFLENAIEQHNQDTGGTAQLTYDTLDRLSETKNYLLLHTKSDQVAVAFKADGLDRNGLIAFLKTRPTRIKWKD